MLYSILEKKISEAYEITLQSVSVHLSVYLPHSVSSEALEIVLLSIRVTLRPTVNWPVCVGVKPHLGPTTRLLLTVVGVLMWGVLSDERTGLSWYRPLIYSFSVRSVSYIRKVGDFGKGKSQICETVKDVHESQGTRTRERLRWRGPAAYTKDSPALSSERAPHKTTVTAK
jgi:hypothetical protein